MNVLDVSKRYENQWVVLDRGQNVVDHGTSLEELFTRHKEAAPRLTFYYASALAPDAMGPLPSKRF